MQDYQGRLHVTLYREFLTDAGERLGYVGFHGGEAEERDADVLAMALGRRWNACQDALAELDRDSSLTLSPEVARAGALLRRAINGEG